MSDITFEIQLFPVLCIVSLFFFRRRVAAQLLLFHSQFSAPRTSPHTQVKFKIHSSSCLWAEAGELTLRYLFPGKLMIALLNGIHDRSTVVQKQFAFALGHLVRVGGASSEHFD